MSTSSKPLIIAEIGNSHNGDTSLGCELIYAAKESGADIAKFQLYNVDIIKKPTDTNYDYLKNNQLSKDDMHLYNETCDKLGIEFCASVFDVERLEWTDDIDMKRIKLASRSLYNEPLKLECLKRKKQIISSVQVDFMPQDVSIFELFGNNSENVDFLYCLTRREIISKGVVGFPSKFSKLAGFTGFSDHCIGLDWAFEAIDRGAEILEKHLTFDLNAAGWDNPSAMTPSQLKQLVDYAEGDR